MAWRPETRRIRFARADGVLLMIPLCIPDAYPMLAALMKDTRMHHGRGYVPYVLTA
jgi:hypothetical protein